MNKQRVIFRSETDDWATPQYLFDKLNYIYKFTLDPCASDTNHKCEKYFTKDQDGLQQDWGGNVVFCNPPYGRELCKWIDKAYNESKKPKTTVVMLLPVRTGTKWWHTYIVGNAKVWFIKGRLKFGMQTNSAPFNSMIVEFLSSSTIDNDNIISRNSTYCL